MSQPGANGLHRLSYVFDRGKLAVLYGVILTLGPWRRAAQDSSPSVALTSNMHQSEARDVWSPRNSRQRLLGVFTSSPETPSQLYLPPWCHFVCCETLRAKKMYTCTHERTYKNEKSLTDGCQVTCSLPDVEQKSLNVFTLCQREARMRKKCVFTRVDMTPKRQRQVQRCRAIHVNQKHSRWREST